MVVLIAGHNPPVQDDMMKQVCYKFKQDGGQEPVISFMEYEAIEDGHPLKYGDHAGYYETSYMMHLTDKVNLDANNFTKLPDLGVGTSIPVNDSNSYIGKQHFELQIKTLSAAVNKAYSTLK